MGERGRQSAILGADWRAAKRGCGCVRPSAGQQCRSTAASPKLRGVAVRNWLWIAVATLVAMPWFLLRLAGVHGPPPLVAALSGLSILGAAFLLSWASEVVQMDIAQALAIVILSFISVLPEYSVDFYLAWRAGQDPTYVQYTLANMTGANRLLVGIGWAAVVLVFWWRSRKPRVHLAEHEMLEISVLVIATLYAFVIPLKGTLSVVDAAVLLLLFGIYAYVTSRQAPEEPDLVGPALTIGSLPVRYRRVVTVALFVFAATAILAAAEPFAEGLVATGQNLRIDQFFLVQWVAPLASEAPEFIVAVLFAWRGHPHLGLRTMISSKVNQWTLLVGVLPVAYAISGGRLVPMVLDQRQLHELLLTAAQSAFGLVLIAGLGLGVRGAVCLALLFLVQTVLPETRLAMTFVYLVLAVVVLAFDRSRLRRLVSSPRALIAAARTSRVR